VSCDDDADDDDDDDDELMMMMTSVWLVQTLTMEVCGSRATSLNSTDLPTEC